jgi:hypothetical protein
MITIPKPVVHIRYNFFIIYITMGIKYDLKPIPNIVFTRRVSGIRYPTSLLTLILSSPSHSFQALTSLTRKLPAAPKIRLNIRINRPT